MLCRKLRLSGEFDYEAIAKGTAGYVGADLSALTKEAAAMAIQRVFHDLTRLGGVKHVDQDTNHDHDHNQNVKVRLDDMDVDADNSVRVEGKKERSKDHASSSSRGRRAGDDHHR